MKRNLLLCRFAAMLRLAGCCIVAFTSFSQGAKSLSQGLDSGNFEWKAGPALIAPAENPSDPCYSVKDPTVIFDQGQWHLWCTIRSQKRTHQIEHIRFADWSRTDEATRHVMNLSTGYFCAPQVFYFTPHQRWYMILQILHPNRKPALQPAFCTTTNLVDDNSWTKPAYLYDAQPTSVKGWIDFWVICDSTRAHLFFTSNDGRMWRAQTSLSQFPHGWTEPSVVLKTDVFEASHTYKVKGREQYLTLIEAIHSGRRYYAAYTASALDSAWTPLSPSYDKAFASDANVRQPAEKWTENISHGEMLRAGNDEHLEIDLDRPRFLFQGVLEQDKNGKAYGLIPWKLGLLELN